MIVLWLLFYYLSIYLSVLAILRFMEKNSKFREKRYWEERFDSESCYEWLADYTKIKHLISPYLQKCHARILILGCGSSRLGFDIYDDGFTEVTQLDYADELIRRLTAESAVNYPCMSFVCCDIGDMGCIADKRFDLVIEKATIDSLLVAEKDPWCLSENARSELDAVLEGISRILDDRGSFLSISFAQPHFRLPIYAKRKYCWSLTLKRFGTDFHYFLYAMNKGGELNFEDLQFYLYPVATKSNVINVSNKYDSSLMSMPDDENFLSRLDLW